MKHNRKILHAAVAVWAMLVGVAVVWMIDYAVRPGRPSNYPAQMPARFAAAAADDSGADKIPTLLVFAHPHCPCSRATFAELRKLTAAIQQPVNVQIYFYQPPGFSRQWIETDLWRLAAENPAARVSAIGDEDLRALGAITSGQVLLYDRDDRLIFSGGITSARGHQGKNNGREALAEYLGGGRLRISETPVFGCALTN